MAGKQNLQFLLFTCLVAVATSRAKPLAGSQLANNILGEVTEFGRTNSNDQLDFLGEEEEVGSQLASLKDLGKDESTAGGDAASKKIVTTRERTVIETSNVDLAEGENVDQDFPQFSDVEAEKFSLALDETDWSGFESQLDESLSFGGRQRQRQENSPLFIEPFAPEDTPNIDNAELVFDDDEPILQRRGKNRRRPNDVNTDASLDLMEAALEEPRRLSRRRPDPVEPRSTSRRNRKRNKGNKRQNKKQRRQNRRKVQIPETLEVRDIIMRVPVDEEQRPATETTANLPAGLPAVVVPNPATIRELPPASPTQRPTNLPLNFPAGLVPSAPNEQPAELNTKPKADARTVFSSDIAPEVFKERPQFEELLNAKLS